MSGLFKLWVAISIAALFACALAVAMSLTFATPAFAGKLNASALKDGGTYDRFIVRFNKNAPEHSNAAARQQLLDAAGRGNGVGIGQLRRLAVGADVIKTDRKLDRIAAQQLMQRLARNPHVEYVELDAIRRPFFTPNDTSYASQWHYHEATAGINLPAAWNKATGSGVVVAVIDTGITPHSDLSANIVAGYDFISDAATARDGNGRDANPNDEGDWAAADDCEAGLPAEDSSWHGTHVAGTVAAVTNNANGVAGVAFNAKVMPLRVIGKCGGYTSDIADAVVWASGGAVSGVPANANPAEVINMSLGGPGTCDATSQAAINAAVAAGTVVVVAAGNENSDVSGFSPASCSNVITVAAVGRTGARASYSNFGSKVDVAAPGGSGANSVLSTLNFGITTQGAESYAGYQGTSMATSHVAGTVALMQSARVNAPAVVEAVLKSTARTFPFPCSGCGTGIIDASAAITAAINPVLIIGDVTVTEGDSGTQLATFTVTLSQPVGTVVSYNIATANGTATAGSDYVARSLTGQSMAVGVTSKTFTVTINGDATPEPTETFLVNVTNVVGVTVADGQAQGTIFNDDPVPLSNGVPVTGISAGIGQQLLYTLAVPAGASGLTFTTSGGLGDADLYVKFGSPPSVSIYECGSFSPTTSETCNIASAQAGTYYVLLDAYSDFSGVSLTGQYTIPSLSIADVSVTEGNSGTKLATLTVKLSQASAGAVTYNIATANSTAVAGSDYVASSLTGQSIAAGLTSKTFTVTINGDTAVEANETFTVNLSSAVGATIADSQAIGTIINDDGPTLSIADVWIIEGNSGTKLATFTVKLSQASASAVTYNIATANSTAAAGSDYVASSLTGQSIAAGLTSKTFTVTINGDTTIEANETFLVNLSAAVGATIADSQAIGTIINDDTAASRAGDFNGDGAFDILWRHLIDGRNVIWKSANASTPQAVSTVADLSWKVVGIGDFNADAKDDILWRNTANGANTIWQSANGATQQAVLGVTSQAWQVAGVDDFDDNGKADILWRNGSTGANTIWKAGNSNTQQAVASVANLDWHIAGVGDFNYDRRADILWRNTRTGANEIWLSGRSTTQQVVAGVTNLTWQVVGVADFNGDGKADILWRNQSTGKNVIWRSGNAATPQAMATVPDLAWRAAATGDYNSDGSSDVLWRNQSTGGNVIWRSADAATVQAVTGVTNLAWVSVP